MKKVAEIKWEMSGAAIEQESFRRIEAEIGKTRDCFSVSEWPVVRRMIHACADFSIAEHLQFRHDPVAAVRQAVCHGAPIYCDSNMIRSGISTARLARFNSTYSRHSIHCHVADSDVAVTAQQNGSTRALAALEKALPMLHGAIVLIGNSPLALAGLVRMIEQDQVHPAVIIGMPVGFVHVVESKEMLLATDTPSIVLKGRRGGSPLAVSALHGALEMAEGKL